MKFSLKNKVWQFAALLFLALIWGSSFILMKRGLESFSNYQVATLRIIFAFFATLPFALLNIKLVKRKHLFPIFIVGFLGNFIPAFLFSKAQTVISSSLAGMLNGLTPLFALLVGVLLFQVKTRWVNVLGVFIGFLGAMGIILSNHQKSFDASLFSVSLVILATLCYAFSVNIIKTYLQDVKAVTVTSIAFLLVGPIALTIFLNTDYISVFNNDSMAFTNLMYLAFLGVFGTGFAVLLFNFLIKQTTAVFASTVTYFIPFVAIFWGVFDGERISISQIASFGVVIIGVYLVMYPVKKN
jgi:drug/metabolite transporter (DMT)-like permease